MAGRHSLTQTGLMPKHKKFISNLMQGRGIQKSAELAGFDGSTGYDLMKNPAIKTALVAKMEKAGITEDMLAKKLKQGLSAKTVPRRDGGKRYDDQFVRKQFLDIIFKLRGDYAPEKIESTQQSIKIIIDAPMINALKDSRALSAEEIDYIECEAIKENNDGEEIEEGEIIGTDDEGHAEFSPAPTPSEGEGRGGGANPSSGNEGSHDGAGERDLGQGLPASGEQKWQ